MIRSMEGSVLKAPERKPTETKAAVRPKTKLIVGLILGIILTSIGVLWLLWLLH